LQFNGISKFQAGDARHSGGTIRSLDQTLAMKPPQAPFIRARAEQTAAHEPMLIPNLWRANEISGSSVPRGAAP